MLPVLLAPGKPVNITVSYTNTIHTAADDKPDIDGCTLFMFNVPVEFDVPEVIRVGEKLWTGFSLPEGMDFGTDYSVKLFKNGQGVSEVKTKPNALGVIAFEIDASTTPLPVPGDKYYAEVKLPANSGSSRSPEVLVLPGEPAKITLDFPGNEHLVADNHGKARARIKVTDKWDNPVEDGTSVGLTISGAQSERFLTGNTSNIPGDGPGFPTYDTVKGSIEFDLAYFMAISPLLKVTAGSITREFTLQYEGLAGELISDKDRLISSRGDVAVLLLDTQTKTTPGTPVLWTVSKFPIESAASKAMVTGSMNGSGKCEFKLNSTGCPSGVCVVTATVAGTLYHKVLTISQWDDNGPFNSKLRTELISGDRAVQAGESPPLVAPSFTTPAPRRSGSLSWAKGALVTIDRLIPGHSVTVELANGPVDLPYVGLKDPNTWTQTSAWDPLSGQSSVTVVAGTDGKAKVVFFSRGILPSSSSRLVPLRVSSNGNSDNHILALAPTHIGTYAIDFFAGALGQDTETHAGTAGAILGGFCVVADGGSLLKNSFRAAGISDKKVDKVELILSTIGLGITFSEVTGIGTAAKATVTILRIVCQRLHKVAPQLAKILVEDFIAWIKSGASAEFKHKRLLTALSKSEDFEKALVRIAYAEDDLASATALTLKLEDDYVKAVSQLAKSGEHSVESLRYANRLLDDICKDAEHLAALKGPKFAEAFEGLVRTLDHGVDPAIVKKVLGNKNLLSGKYTITRLLTDLGEVPKNARTKKALPGC